MRLHEYQTKQIFYREGIPIPIGRIASTTHEGTQVTKEIGLPAVIKAQVQIGGRGKAGGIKILRNGANIEEEISDILGNRIKNFVVKNVLIEKAVEIKQEIYLGITYDRTTSRPIIITSGSGGIDIEEIANKTPERISKAWINPLIGLRDYTLRDLASNIDLPREYWSKFLGVSLLLWAIYQKYDATLIEINPLVINTDNELIALDGKMTIDDNALFRQKELSTLQDLSYETKEEQEARKFGLNYISLSGDIGCLVNGAGLAMATMDNIKICGGEPANFLDIGGGADAEKVEAALRLILLDRKVKSILINIFGGITRCDEVAKGILAIIEKNKIEIPLIIRLVGTNSEKGSEILKNANQITANNLYEAAKLAVDAAKMMNHEHINQ